MNSNLVELQKTLYSSKNPTRKWIHCSRRDWIIRHIEQIASMEKTDSSLEIGPGSGIYLPVLLSYFNQVMASDIEQSYLDFITSLAVEHSNLTLVTDDITNSQLPPETFDLILCTEVIEHIADSQAALNEMWKLLKPGGFLIISTPQKWSPLEVAAKVAFLPIIIDLVRLIYQEPILETGHINLMTSKQVIKQIKLAGFHIQESFKTGVYLPLIAELTGNWGLNLERWLEKKLRNSFFDWLLWTQYYIAQK